jgi:hypothetical protein
VFEVAVAPSARTVVTTPIANILFIFACIAPAQAKRRALKIISKRSSGLNVNYRGGPTVKILGKNTYRPEPCLGGGHGWDYGYYGYYHGYH